MKSVDSLQRLTYISDFVNNDVAVFTRPGTLVGVIGGLYSPQGLFVDSARNLWVANTGVLNVLEFARGSTSPTATLEDPVGYPVDVTICPNRTVYVSNVFALSPPNGDIAVYPPGGTEPTKVLTFPGQGDNYYVTCDAANNVFTTLADVRSGLVIVVEYPRGNALNARQVGSLTFPSPASVKATGGGKLLIDDTVAGTITEYTEAGLPTGRSISTGSGEIAQIAATRNERVVGGADAMLLRGSSWTFPGGAPRQTYNAPPSSPFAEPAGFAFDPG